MLKAQVKLISRKARAKRVRKNIVGTSERPRLCVRRTLKHIYAQIIDDSIGKSLINIGSSGKETTQIIADSGKKAKSDTAKLIGEIVATKAIEKGITKVVFDRKGYPFHGRIKALADAARAKGLQF